VASHWRRVPPRQADGDTRQVRAGGRGRRAATAGVVAGSLLCALSVAGAARAGSDPAGLVRPLIGTEGDVRGSKMPVP